MNAFLTAFFNRPNTYAVTSTFRFSKINEQTAAKSPSSQSKFTTQQVPTVSRPKRRITPKNISVGTETIETTGPERVRCRQAVVKDSDQRRNENVLQKYHEHNNQDLVQIESNKTAASDEETDLSRKKKVDTENNDAIVRKKKRSKKASKTKSSHLERRKARIMQCSPKLIQKRMDSAESQQMFWISRSIINELHQEFIIFGATGKLFVYLKVLRMNRNNSYVYQKALLSQELRSIFANAIPDPTFLASYRTFQQYNAFISKEFCQKRRKNGVCDICHEPLEENDRDHIAFATKDSVPKIHKDCFGKCKKLKL
ncbi:2056_t:CDS:2 [Funneliformis geosporum]|uniref:15635_t:CDS:1 n=1 Tax=Funneliformis geosporum TaxID=1117311 RepID=A0A9W4SMF7_9GLOM|nr:15635_t:CDS:2 [Funneliformis geosporum]CAI2174620.1 2056_t:CDS:2 [Funneliformis geosporum]